MLSEHYVIVKSKSLICKMLVQASNFFSCQSLSPFRTRFAFFLSIHQHYFPTSKIWKEPAIILGLSRVF